MKPNWRHRKKITAARRTNEAALAGVQEGIAACARELAQPGADVATLTSRMSNLLRKHSTLSKRLGLDTPQEPEPTPEPDNSGLVAELEARGLIGENVRQTRQAPITAAAAPEEYPDTPDPAAELDRALAEADIQPVTTRRVYDPLQEDWIDLPEDGVRVIPSCPLGGEGIMASELSAWSPDGGSEELDLDSGRPRAEVEAEQEQAELKTLLGRRP